MIFAVYGTLKKNFGNHRLLEKATFLGSHVTEPAYTMYSLGGFPAVCKGGSTPIKVELYQTDDQNIIDNVNRLEGYSGIKNHPANWYDTETISTPYGEAEMFIFKKTPPLAPIVETGEW